MITKSPCVVGCSFKMIAVNSGDSFVTELKCPVGHPKGMAISDLLDKCLQCPERKPRVTVVRKYEDGSEFALRGEGYIAGRKRPPKNSPKKPLKAPKKVPGKKPTPLAKTKKKVPGKGR